MVLLSFSTFFCFSDIGIVSIIFSLFTLQKKKNRKILFSSFSHKRKEKKSFFTFFLDLITILVKRTGIWGAYMRLLFDCIDLCGKISFLVTACTKRYSDKIKKVNFLLVRKSLIGSLSLSLMVSIVRCDFRLN